MTESQREEMDQLLYEYADAHADVVTGYVQWERAAARLAEARAALVAFIERVAAGPADSTSEVPHGT